MPAAPRCCAGQGPARELCLGLGGGHRPGRGLGWPQEPAQGQHRLRPARPADRRRRRLAIVATATLRLYPRPTHHQAALVGCATLAQCVSLLQQAPHPAGRPASPVSRSCVALRWHWLSPPTGTGPGGPRPAHPQHPPCPPGRSCSNTADTRPRQHLDRGSGEAAARSPATGPHRARDAVTDRNAIPRNVDAARNHPDGREDRKATWSSADIAVPTSLVPPSSQQAEAALQELCSWLPHRLLRSPG